MVTITQDIHPQITENLDMSGNVLIMQHLSLLTGAGQYTATGITTTLAITWI